MPLDVAENYKETSAFRTLDEQYALFQVWQKELENKMTKSCHSCYFDISSPIGCPIHSDKPNECKWFTAEKHMSLIGANIIRKEIFDEAIKRDLDKQKGNISCGHPSCLSHVSHPCEKCGRIAGKLVANRKFLFISKEPK